MKAKGILSLLLATVTVGFSLASAAQVVPARYAIADLSGPGGSINLNLTIPVSTAFDKQGNLYVMDLSNGGSATTAKLYKITPDNTVTLYADLGSHFAPNDGVRSFTIADNGDVLIAGGQIIYRYTPNGAFSTVAGYKFTWTDGHAPADLNPMIDGDVSTGRFTALGGIAVDSDGTIFVTDANTVRMFKNGQISTLAGFEKFGAGYGYVDGQGANVRFDNPFGIAVDSSHNIYVSDSSNNVIRKVTTDGTVTTVAGIAGSTGGYQDGATMGQALFSGPWNLAIDTLGNLYVTDLDNARIRKVDLRAGMVSTVVTPTKPGEPYYFFSDVFSGPGAVSVDKAGNLFVLDQIASTIGTNNPSWLMKQALLITTPGNAQIINLSARAATGSGESTFIAGLVVKGTTPVLARAVGPTLSLLGVPNPLGDPFEEWHNSSGAVTNSNDDWDGKQSTVDISNSVGAFGLPQGSKDAVMYLPAVSGLNTMFVTAKTGQDGTAIAEFYNASPDLNPNNRFVNISARGLVQPGNPLIGGFVIKSTDGSGKKVLIRGLGPALAGFGLKTALTHPKLTVYDSKGNVIASNDIWGGNSILQATDKSVGAFDLQPDSKDAVLLLPLAPGAYTAQVTAADDSTGVVASVEIYEVQ